MNKTDLLATGGSAGGIDRPGSKAYGDKISIT